MLSSHEPICLTPTYLVAVTGNGVDLDQTAADVAGFSIPFKCAVDRAQLHITEACAGPPPGVVDMDSRPTAGSDTGRGAADIAHFLMGTTAAGKLLYDLAGQNTILYPGMEVVVQIATQPVTGPAGHFVPQLLVVFIPEEIINLSAMVATA